MVFDNNHTSFHPERGTYDSNESFALSLFLSELNHEEAANRIEVIKKWKTISILLGPEKTREQLLPHLLEVAQDDEDEVLSFLSEEVNNMLPYIGGIEHVTCLLNILEILATKEETIVREKVIPTLKYFTEHASETQLIYDIVPLIERLTKAVWFFARVSATNLYEVALSKLDNIIIINNLLSLFLQLIEDETPMVRRSAANAFPKILNTIIIKQNELDNDIWIYISTVLKKISSDRQDTVRALSVYSVITLLQSDEINNKEKYNGFLFKVVNKMIQDEAWRVRCSIAENCDILLSLLNDENDTNHSFLKLLLSLCDDNEIEVRKVMGKRLYLLADSLKNKTLILAYFISYIQNLSMDENETVRASLAMTVGNISSNLGKEETIVNLVPIYLSMLKDEFPEVRLNIIGNLKIVNDIIGAKILSDVLLPVLFELGKDMNWRIRIAIVEYIPILAGQLGVEIFHLQLTELCYSWLWDTVHVIREAAIKNLTLLTEIFGKDWSRENIIRRLVSSDKEILENFAYRSTILSALTALTGVVDCDIIEQDIIPFVSGLENDPVPNIRFTVSKSYGVIAKRLYQLDGQVDIVDMLILPSLINHLSDKDQDVQYFSKQALDQCQKLRKEYDSRYRHGNN
ncbi:hypothetical protein Kpol_1044p5 [Vanderwaltozyma polyspora DSM 70294]|uniref:Phosphatase 2A Regulatory Subunit A helical domain-containing protein n=1 Tax=Vanderwaltozyma polyspora (strain ATCC 22028 / DSM 70294 / BCRC 21397 / CBS 2163 / NBRC 10782 / NRRL Y-8283 / UCD 57-17) TaxID=436907 RepID=A7TP37_VANPO|nr:uncharacterized protein Kpol_1044p5 [Vanderwaltozyma polyspora DSM 70294]EDO15947.1 hypothetical protein Kpol_1044p5 [Vanderwaltozyma polyspora DSM 70294]